MPNNVLIGQLIDSGYLKKPDIIKAFEKINRADFVPSEQTIQAYQNIPLPIGSGQTISQPLTVAFMLELLRPEKGDKILEIGFGSGWQTSLMAELVGPKGRIFAIERIQEVYDLGKKNLEKYDFINKGIVKLYYQDGSKGLKTEALFDKIISAASIDCKDEKILESVPKAWKKQIKTGGIIVTPINYSIFRFKKISDDKFEIEEYPGFVFVPLVRR